MEPAASPRALTEAEVLFGGRNLTVHFRNGTSREIFVRLICLSEIPEFLDRIATNEEDALRSVLSEASDLNLDSLTLESYQALMEANLEVNFTVALASQRAKLARAEKTGLGVTGLLNDLASLSRSFAQISPSPEDGRLPISTSKPSPGFSSSGGGSVPLNTETPSPGFTPQA